MAMNCAEAGARGGISRSEHKIAAARRNIQKATQARRRRKRVLTPEQQQQWKEWLEKHRWRV